jgi:methylated-DNA-[protein]-cysteine S-methyltransferase
MNAHYSFADDLAHAFPDTPDHLRLLRDRLAATAQAEDLLDVAYRTLDTPVGSLLLAATERGLVRVAYASEDHDAVLQRIADLISPRILNATGRLDVVARELDEYFARQRRAFDVAVDWRLANGFRGTVLRHLPDIAYGHTASYTSIAQAVGHPKAMRAVGGACATNPLPIVVPCHRVVRSDGTLGGYRGGVEAKRALLALEAEP